MVEWQERNAETRTIKEGHRNETRSQEKDAEIQIHKKAALNKIRARENSRGRQQE